MFLCTLAIAFASAGAEYLEGFFNDGSAFDEQGSLSLLQVRGKKAIASLEQQVYYLRTASNRTLGNWQCPHECTDSCGDPIQMDGFSQTMKCSACLADKCTSEFTANCRKLGGWDCTKCLASGSGCFATQWFPCTTKCLSHWGSSDSECSSCWSQYYTQGCLDKYTPCFPDAFSNGTGEPSVNTSAASPLPAE
eukprot:TRINITY_DN58628_c0_g1_i1.p1 TRINITY_DN58628_c0_g1~~TRINITY_DN58628_c0_g1_i1.p1  ORF type:complete len:193 (+),score=23.38 TRINITY_DN58628_c0_g1_i1:66-644(+)